jgi:hypothetical protein
VIKELGIGIWNVLTVYKGGVMRNLEKVLQEYRMDITAIQEICWIGQRILERVYCTMYYSCQKSKHEFGCGFVVNKKVKHLVMDFTLIDRRICVLRVRERFNNMSLICSSAPTEEKNGNIKDTFYDAVEKPSHIVQGMM